ncbi:hypothetical protein LTR28_008072, partial [Elasticomyces elasticus]
KTAIPSRLGGGDVRKRTLDAGVKPGAAGVGAEMPSPEPGEEAEWNMETRRRTRAQASAGTARAVKPGQIDFTFAAATAATKKKRKAEEGMADQLAQLKDLVLALNRGQDEIKTL